MAGTRHLLYIDESGGHDMEHVDPNYPVFVLLGLLVGEKYYARTLVPRVKAVKEQNGLDRGVLLHSSSIRRQEREFAALSDVSRRNRFYESLNKMFRTSRIRIYAVVIDKRRLKERYILPPDPYDVSLSQLLSLTCGPPGTPTVWRPNVDRIVAESRGRREDKQLQNHYQHFRALGLSSYGADGVQSRRAQTVDRVFPVRIDFVGKSKVVTGLELADLAAYPLGRAYVNKDWSNPAYLAVATKVRGFVAFP